MSRKTRLWQLVDFLVLAGTVAGAKEIAKQRGYGARPEMWEKAVMLYLERGKHAFTNPSSAQRDG